MDSTLGAFDAKTQLSRLLREVEQGQRFTISVRSKPVADRVPHQNAPGNAATAAAGQALQTFPMVHGLHDDDLAKRRGVIRADHSDAFLDRLHSLPITTDTQPPAERQWRQLELALRLDVVLAP